MKYVCDVCGFMMMNREHLIWELYQGQSLRICPKILYVRYALLGKKDLVR